MVGKGGLAEPQAPFLKQISILQTTDAGIYMDVVDNDPVNDGQVFSTRVCWSLVSLKFCFIRLHLRSGSTPGCVRRSLLTEGNDLLTHIFGKLADVSLARIQPQLGLQPDIDLPFSIWQSCCSFLGHDGPKCVCGADRHSPVSPLGAVCAHEH